MLEWKNSRTFFILATFIIRWFKIAEVWAQRLHHGGTLVRTCETEISLSIFSSIVRQTSALPRPILAAQIKHSILMLENRLSWNRQRFGIWLEKLKISKRRKTQLSIRDFWVYLLFLKVTQYLRWGLGSWLHFAYRLLPPCLRLHPSSRQVLVFLMWKLTTYSRLVLWTLMTKKCGH